MIREQRLRHILEELQQSGVVSISELTKALGISCSNIRRDLGELEEKHLLKCICGGAVMILRPVAGDPHHYDPQALCAGGKRRIAQRATELVPENGTIPLYSGTTVYELARQLAQHRGLTLPPTV